MSSPSSPPRPERSDPRVLVGIRVAHTLIWLSIESSMGYLLFAGFTGRTGRRVALAGAVVAGECLVFLGNGFRCPLTDLAESLGAEHGSVTELYLPAWFARNMPAIHVPFLLLAVVLYRRNIRPVRHGNPRRRDERRDVLVPFASPAPGEGRLWSFATRR